MPPFLLYDHFLLIKIKSCLGYNMSLDDACHFEKRLFHASFATVCFHLFCFFIYFSVYLTTGTLIYDGCANMIQFNFTVTYYSLRVLCFRFLFYLSFLCIEQLTYSPIQICGSLFERVKGLHILIGLSKVWLSNYGT